MEEAVTNQVFISHSRRDYSGIRYILLLCKAIRLHPIMVEYEEMSEEEADDIRKWISESKYIFVLLSDHIFGSDFTQNWISFEMGIAHDNNIPIFLFENLNKPVDFPVPYIDYHIHYLDNQKDVNYLKECFENINNTDGDYFIPMECNECKKFWIMRSDVVKFSCPYCLNELVTEDDEDEDDEDDE